MLWVCATASSTDGASRTCELRDALGTTATSEDERHRALLLRATAWAEAVVGRPLLAQVYSESVAAYGGRRLALRGDDLEIRCTNGGALYQLGLADRHGFRRGRLLRSWR